MLHAEHFRGLALAQTPKVMVIACCDSRVDPALLMGCALAGGARGAPLVRSSGATRPCPPVAQTRDARPPRAGPGDIFTVRNSECGWAKRAGVDLGRRPPLADSVLLPSPPSPSPLGRAVANLVPPFERQGSYHGTSAALEYAVRCPGRPGRPRRSPSVRRTLNALAQVRSLKVEHIVVMGHQHCGGIRQLMTRAAEATQKNDFIDSWMEIARSAWRAPQPQPARPPA